MFNEILNSLYRSDYGNTKSAAGVIVECDWTDV